MAATDANTDAGREGVSRVIVGLDDSNGALKALHWAAAHARVLGPIQPVTAWHHPWWSLMARATATDSDDAAMTQEVRRIVEEVLTPIDSDDLLPPIIRKGPPGPVLVEEGGMEDVLVIGTRERGPVTDTILGSVSMYCVNHAVGPVVVVPPHAAINDVTRHVVVGVDGSSNSVAALAWALRVLPVSTTIEVVHSWHLPVEGVPEVVSMRSVDAEEEARATLARTVRLATEAAGSTGERKLVARSVAGDPRRTLEYAASGLDLLVIGARGEGPLAHLPLGSVASALAHRPVTTLVVVPPENRG